jgi:hypothetical protein
VNSRPTACPRPLFRPNPVGWTAVACLLAALAGPAILAQPAGSPPPPPVPAPGPVSSSPTGSIAGEEREALIVLDDGQRLEGVLVEDTTTQVTLRIGDIATPIPRERIQRVTVLPPVIERYRDLRAAMTDDDADGLVSLADWLVRRRRLDLALQEMEALLIRRPDFEPARQMRDLVAQQIMLRDRRTPPSLPAGPAPGQPSIQSDAGTAAAPAVPLLSAEQINLIKVFELDLANPPSLSIPRPVMERALERYAGNPLIPASREGREAILRQGPVEQLDLLFRLRAREFYGSVRVQGQPESIRRFKDDVHATFLINACATSACHGGLEAGRLVLANRRPQSDPTVYTNLLILERFRTSDGRPLIDWDQPERSVLLHMGLPREDSLARHPVVPRAGTTSDAWRPTFRSTDDLRFQEIVRWMKSMYQPRPDSGMDYTPVRPFTPPAPAAPGQPAAPR